MSTCKRYNEQELQQLLSDGIAELQRENAELKKDKARLDWLVQILFGALQRISNMDSTSYHSLESAKIVARKALVAWSQRDEAM